MRTGEVAEDLDAQADVSQPLVVWIFGALWAVLVALVAALWKTMASKAWVLGVKDKAVNEVTERYEKRDADLLNRVLLTIEDHQAEQLRMHVQNRDDQRALRTELGGKLDTVLATVRPNGH